MFGGREDNLDKLVFVFILNVLQTSATYLNIALIFVAGIINHLDIGFTDVATRRTYNLSELFQFLITLTPYLVQIEFQKFRALFNQCESEIGKSLNTLIKIISLL